jgi:hypothetical protein
MLQGRVRQWIIGAAVAAGVGGSVARAANENTPMMQYLGYTSLWTTYGANLADGSNVSVSQVESGNLYLNSSDGRFSNKTLTKTSTFTGNETGSSGHATIIGARFFGNDTGFSQRSVAPKTGNSPTSSVQMYTYSQWAGSFYLNPGSPVPYGSANNSRVSSHAYGATDTTLNTATRMDYTVQRDDFLHVVDATQWSTEGNTFNSVVVTPAQGTTLKTAQIGGSSVYTAGRVSPTVTGPLTGAGSDAIGQTAGVVALLMSRGKMTTSHVSYTTADTLAVTAPYTGVFSTYTKPGYIVNSGETAEVVKAALMAGALRSVPSAGSPLDLPGISDYRVAAVNQSSNGLDFRFGAGMVNAEQSYKIINAGETNSMQDGGSGAIGQYGFDYDIGFGGGSVTYKDGNGNTVTEATTNRTADYGFTANASSKFMASLVWNVKINGASTVGGNFDSTATLHNMTLTLTDLTDGVVVQQSASLVDNTQNLWVNLVAGHEYRLTVAAVGTFGWDYGLAWRSEGALTPTAVPEPAMLSLVAVAGYTLLHRRRR